MDVLGPIPDRDDMDLRLGRPVDHSLDERIRRRIGGKSALIAASGIGGPELREQLIALIVAGEHGRILAERLANVLHALQIFRPIFRSRLVDADD